MLQLTRRSVVAATAPDGSSILLCISDITAIFSRPIAPVFPLPTVAVPGRAVPRK